MTARPHNLHQLAQAPDAIGSTLWGCWCGHTGTAPTADDAVAAYEAHVAESEYLTRALIETARDWHSNNYERTAPIDTEITR